MVDYNLLKRMFVLIPLSTLLILLTILFLYVYVLNVLPQEKFVSFYIIKAGCKLLHDFYPQAAVDVYLLFSRTIVKFTFDEKFNIRLQLRT